MDARRRQRGPPHAARVADTMRAGRLCTRSPLRMLLIALMLLAMIALPALTAAGAPQQQQLSSDCAATPLPSVVRIAILVFCDAAAGKLADHPFVSCGEEKSVNRKKFITQSMQGLQMYTDLMRDQQANILPLPSGANVTLQFTYINQGRVNFDDAAAFPALRPSLIGPDGLWASVTNSTRAQEAYGGGFTFIVSSASTPDSALPTLINQCEESGECIVVLPYYTSIDVMSCTSGAEDCVRRGRLPGTRRWSNALASASLSLDYANGPLDLLKVQGVRTLARFGQAKGRRGTTYISELSSRTSVLAAQLGIRTVFATDLVLCDESCGPAETHVFPNRTTAEAAAEIAAANPDALIFLAGELPYPFSTFAALFDEFKRIDWTPRALVILVGADLTLPKYLPDPTIIQYAMCGSTFDPRIRGPQFRNYKTASNFELIPATESKDGPQVFTEALLAKFPPAPGDPDLTSGGTSYIPVDNFQALVIAQKLIEFAETAHVPSLLLAATRISAPSYIRPVEFDVTGVMRFQLPFMMQLTPKSANATRERPFDYSILTPYNVGVPPVFPLPTWKERVYQPAFYATPAEQAIVSLTVVLLLACAVLLALIGIWRHHPVISSSTPVFCCLVVLGCMAMLLSNFFNTLHVDDAHCAAQVWLLTFGFSLSFGALFTKTYRVHAVLSSKHLSVVGLPQRQLLLAVALILAVDAVINIAWAATAGMRSQLVVVDPVRPLYNYTQCAYGGGQMGFVFAHVAVKCTLLLCGMMLAWKVRRAPSLFSESTHISVCIYNVSVVLTFLLPVLATGLGGRSAMYLIRSLSICFVATTTCIVLLAPKFWTIHRSRPEAERSEHEHEHEYALKTDATRGVTGGVRSSVLPDAQLTDFQQPPPSDVFSMKREGVVSPVMSAGGFDDATQQPHQQPTPVDTHPSASGLTVRRVPHSARYAPSAAAATTSELNTPEHTSSTELATLHPAGAAGAGAHHRLPAAPSAVAATALVVATVLPPASASASNRLIRIHVLADDDDEEREEDAAEDDSAAMSLH